MTTPVDAAAGGRLMDATRGGWGSNAEAEMVCGVSSLTYFVRRCYLVKSGKSLGSC